MECLERDSVTGEEMTVLQLDEVTIVARNRNIPCLLYTSHAAGEVRADAAGNRPHDLSPKTDRRLYGQVQACQKKACGEQEMCIRDRRYTHEPKNDEEMQKAIFDFHKNGNSWV